MKLFEFKVEVNLLVAAANEFAAQEIAEQAFSGIHGDDLISDADYGEVDATKIDKDSLVEVEGALKPLSDAIDFSSYVPPPEEKAEPSRVKQLEVSLREMIDLARMKMNQRRALLRSIVENAK